MDNVMPPVNQASVVQKPKNYFVIALVITIIACAVEVLAGIAYSVITGVFNSYLNYEIQTIIVSLLNLFINIVRCGTVFFGFSLWSKNKIAAFRFSGIFFFVFFMVNEFQMLISSLNTYVSMYIFSNYTLQRVVDVISSLFAISCIVVVAPVLYNVLNKRKRNYTIFIWQKKKVLSAALTGILALQLPVVVNIIYGIASFTGYGTMIGWMVSNLFGFFFLLAAVAVIGIMGYNFRKDGIDILSLCSLVFFPRIITILISGLLSIVANIFTMFVSANMLSVIINIVDLLISLIVTAVIVYLTIKNFFPIVNNIPVQDNFSSFPQYPISAAQEVTAQGITISREINTTTETPDVSPFRKTEINENGSGESEPTIKE